MIFQTLMFLYFCSTWAITFSVTLSLCENIYKAICLSSVLWSTYLFALTEGLSAYKAITGVNIFIGWGIFLVVMMFFCVMKIGVIKNRLKFLLASLCELSSDNDLTTKVLCYFIIFFMLIRTILAVFTVPYGADSMTYHLARIMYWIQYRSVDYFYTPVIRQLISPVFAEYINLHVMSLTKGDIFVNMVQNFASYGCIIFVYALVRKLGLGQKWALFACVITLSMNIFAAESISTQVDMLGAFYLIMLVYLLSYTYWDSNLNLSSQNIFDFAIMGLCFGFLYITKTNAAIPATIITVLVIIVRLFRKDSIVTIILLSAIASIFILLIISPTFVRNYQFAGDIFAKSYMKGIAIGSLYPKYIFVNIVKNLSSIGVERNADLLKVFVYILSGILHINADAPEISLMKNLPFEVHYAYNMDYAGAHIVIPLFLATTFIGTYYLLRRRTLRDVFLCVLILQLFSSLIVIRWQPWSSRLVLPSLILSVIPIVSYFKEIFYLVSKSKKLSKLCIFLGMELLFQCLFCSSEGLIFHGYVAAKNIFGNQQRFSLYIGPGRVKEINDAYDNIFRVLERGNYQTIGMYGTGSSYQYPILAKYVFQGKRIENVKMYDVESEIPTEEFESKFRPDVILVTDVENVNTEHLYACNDDKYRCIYSISGQDSKYSIWIRT